MGPQGLPCLDARERRPNPTSAPCGLGALEANALPSLCPLTPRMGARLPLKGDTCELGQVTLPRGQVFPGVIAETFPGPGHVSSAPGIPHGSFLPGSRGLMSQM